MRPVAWDALRHCLVLPVIVALLMVVIRWKPPEVYTWVVGILLLLNMGWYASHASYVRTSNEQWRDVAEQIDEALAPDDELLILTDGLAEQAIWHAAFRNKNLLLHLNEPTRIGFARPMKFREGGRIFARRPFTESKSWLLAANDWTFNKPPVLEFEDYALYRLAGEQSLEMDMDQVAQHIRPFEPPETADPAEPGLDQYLADVRLSYYSILFRREMKPGSSQRVTLFVRNDSPFALPSGEIEAGVRYHWANPDLSGNWNPLAGFSTANLDLPENLAPGEMAWLDFDVELPAEASGLYYLVIAPTLTTGDEQHVVMKSDKQIVWILVVP